MNEQELRAWEKRCIQEELPECTAACPLHVDARAFVTFIAQGRFPDAWNVLRRTMPVPGILGRLCDAPCQRRCTRQHAGDAIRIGVLERACVATPAPPWRIQSYLTKKKRVAVAGSGLSSLTVAWDLAHKGYPVTIFDERGALGASFLDRGVSEETVRVELGHLTHLGIESRLETGLGVPDSLESTLASFDALYLGLEDLPQRNWGLEYDVEGVIRITPMYQTTSREGVFAGGCSTSPVWQAASGRWAATSMDRFLQGISLTAGRENEGPQTTRLYVNLKQVCSEPSVLPADGMGYAEAEAVAEARRCLQCQCLECVKACRFLEHFGSYPKKYVRDIFANETMAKGIRTANKLINSCSLCGLCKELCPNDFAMQDVCLEARQSMVRRNKMPDSAHEFAIQDMLSANSERTSLAFHEPGMEQSTFLFFPGCQLSAIDPDHVVNAYTYLRRVFQGGVGLMLRCCAAPARWAGRDDLFRDAVKELEENWERLGRPKLLLACPTCYQVMKEHLPHAEFRMVWEVLDYKGTPKNLTLAIHDPCTTRYEPAMQEAVRSLVKQLGCSIEELALGRDKTECCGFGGLMSAANPSLAKDVARTRGLRSITDYVTYCAMCRNAIARTGKRVVHIFDLFFGKTEEDLGGRKPAGFSERRENRTRLKDRLMRELWGEKGSDIAGYEEIILYLASDVETLMDERHILREDLQKTIEHSETSGARLKNSRTGHFLASFRPDHVTFWVEYGPEEDGFRVYNAYCHRMEITGAMQ
jgi:glutamate synthase (NADPH) small chain